MTSLVAGITIVVKHPVLIHHLVDIMRIGQGKSNSMQFFFDTTYNVGTYFVSPLSFRHPLLKGRPVIPFAFLVHEFTDSASSHVPFFEEISKSVPKLNRTAAAHVIVTDRERSIKDAVTRALPNINHFFCYLHMTKVIASMHQIPALLSGISFAEPNFILYAEYSKILQEQVLIGSDS